MGKHRIIAGIYEILNTINNKRYIGYSENILNRWDRHKYNLRRKQSSCTHLQSSWSIYGEKVFKFSIIEILPSGLSKQQYEEVETKWVLYFKSNKQAFGYNGVMPGSYPLLKGDENKTNLNRKKTKYICIHKDGQIISLYGRKEVGDLVKTNENKIADLSAYWRGRRGRKSLNGWRIIKEENYNPEFDYIKFKKLKKSSEVKKTWRDYYSKKNKEDIIPYKERNLKRRKIVAVNIETGEEKYYDMIKDCYSEFDRSKVGRCLRCPFGQHQHRGHYFKYMDV